MKRAAPYILLVVGTALGVALLVTQALSVTSIQRDDGASYLSATGHLTKFADKGPRYKWVSAGEWQSFWTPERFGCFKTIARDQARSCNHPPLHFWALHLWAWVYGVSLSTGPLLNTFFHILVVVGLFAACRTLKSPPWIAAVMSALWIVSQVSLVVGIQARNYSLLTAVAVWFLVVAIRFYERATRWRAVGLCLLGAAGLLTHFHFFLFLGAISGFMAVRLLMARDRRAFVLLFVAMAVAGLIFVLLHPTFHVSIARQASFARPFVWSGVPQRLSRVARAPLELFVNRKHAEAAWPAVWIAGFVGALALVVAFRKRIAAGAGGFLRSAASLPLIGLVAATFVIVGLYLTFRSPGHAMGAKYLMLVTPALFVVLAQLLTALDARKRRLAMVVAALLLVSQAAYSGWETMRLAKRWERSDRRAARFTRPRKVRIVMDSSQKGVLPRTLWQTDPKIPVYAGKQKVILGSRFPDLPPSGTILYISVLKYGNTAEGRKRMFKAFADRGYTRAGKSGRIMGVGEAFVLKKGGTRPR